MTKQRLLKRSRRAVLLSTLGILALAQHTGCDSPANKELTILGEDFSNTHAMAAVSEGYAQAEGIELKFVMNNFDLFDRKATEDLRQGTGFFDIILHYSSELPQYVPNDWVLMKEEYRSFYPEGDYETLERDLFNEVWRDSSYYPTEKGGEAAAAGYPFAANTMVLVYNRKLFGDAKIQSSYQELYGEALRPPETWPDFLDIAEHLTSQGESQYGVVLQGASGSPLYWEWCNFAFGMGGGVMDKDYGWDSTPSTPLLLSTAETVAATELYLSLKPYNAGDFFSTSQAEQQERMKTQDIGMAIMWSDSLFPLVEEDPDRFGFAPIPGQVSMIGGGTYYINKNSPIPGLAIKYVLDSLSPETQVELVKRGLTSPRKSIYESQEISHLPYIPAVRQSLARGVYMLEAAPDAGLIREVIEKTVQNLWRDAPVGAGVVQEALEQAEDEIERRRPQYWKGR